MLEHLDYIVLIAYLLIVAAIGFFSGRGQSSTKDYFLGGRSIPFWAAGLSILATETSALTFLGAPTQSLFGDWAYIQLAIGSILARFVVARVLIPAYYRANVFTVYGYLEQRFGVLSKNLASALFVVGRCLGSGVRLFGAAIAFTILVPDVPYPIVIAVIAGVAVAYTLAGGIRSVIWTDVLQGLLLFTGGGIALFYLVQAAPENAYEILTTIDPETGKDKLHWLNLEFSFTESYSLIGGALGVFFLTMSTHGTDQDMIQRALTCHGAAGGQRSLWVSAALTLPIVVLFLSVGSALFVQFGSAEAVNAQQLALEAEYGLATNKGRDYIFPHWVLTELPAGLKGVILAGLFAAAMSSLDSAIAALSSTAVKNVYEPYLRPGASEAHYLRAGRVFSLVFGVVLSGVALFVWATEGGGDASQGFGVLVLGLKVLTWIFPPLLGVFLLGVLTERGSDGGNVLALICAISVLLAVEFWPSVFEGSKIPWAWVWNAPIGCVLSFGIASLFEGPGRKLGQGGIDRVFE